MKIFIESPTWLGDAIMMMPSIQIIRQAYPKSKITILVNPKISNLFLGYPNIQNIIEDKSKFSKIRALYLYKQAKGISNFDIAISFRSSLATKFLIHLIKSEKKFIYKKNKNNTHQVIKYANFINSSLKIDYAPKSIKMYEKLYSYKKPTIGFVAGSSYGDAKRWFASRFALVAKTLSDNGYNVVFFGTTKEKEYIDNNIINVLKNKEAKNYTNLAGKTDIKELIKKISGLSLLVSNDTGAMHIASAFKTPTIAIFGPTNPDQTSQWQNPNSINIVKKIECSFCQKRVCPLNTKECMRLIDVDEIIKASKNILKKD